MSRKALIVGINYVGTSSALNGCVNDALNVKSFLIKEYGLEVENIHLMTEAGPNELCPTRANIMEQIDWLVKDATEASRLFMHYAGHGTQIADKNNDENDRRDECICPLDYASAGLIDDDDLRCKLVDPLPKGAKLFGLFDCCHSGTILDLKYNYLFHSSGSRDSYEMQVERRAKLCKAGVTLISGCLDYQTSADAWIDGKAQGAMTYSFLKSYETLKAKKRPMTCQRLMKELHKKIQEGHYVQRPKLSTSAQVPMNRILHIMDGVTDPVIKK